MYRWQPARQFHTQLDRLEAPGEHVQRIAHEVAQDSEQVIAVGPMSGKSNVTWFLEKRGVVPTEEQVARLVAAGAGAVVTRPLPDRVIAAGVPARIVRQRDEVGSALA